MYLDPVRCEFTYKEVKEDTFITLDGYYKWALKADNPKHLYKDAVDRAIKDFYNIREHEAIIENGMERAYIFIAGYLWLIGINKDHEDVAREVWENITILKAGKHDVLIDEDDKEELFADIETVYNKVKEMHNFK